MNTPAAGRRDRAMTAEDVLARVEEAAEECFDEDGDPFDEGYALRFARDVLRILAEWAEDRP